MEGLYNELWGKELPSFNKSFNIPWLQFYIPLDKRNDSAVPQAPAHIDTQEFTFLSTLNPLPSGLQTILVRDEYVRLEGRLVDHNSKKWFNTVQCKAFAQLDCKISGQTGSGKSVLLDYLLVRRLVTCQPTIYRRNDAECFLFDNNFKGRKIDILHLLDLGNDEKRNIWILTDDAVEDARWTHRTHNWSLVMAVPPNKAKASRQWEKDRNVRSLAMSNWKWPEIYSAFTRSLYPESGEPTLTETAGLFGIFTCLGPVARTCLWDIPPITDEDYDDRLNHYLRVLDKEIEDFFQQGNSQSLDHQLVTDSSHKMALMEPDNYGSFTTRISTRYIAHRMIDAEHQQSRKRAYEFYITLSGQKFSRAGAGWMFEGYAHQWFHRGGIFKADKLPVVNPGTVLKFKTNASTSGLRRFTSSSDLAKQVKVSLGGCGIDVNVLETYFEPYARTQESFDGIVFKDPKTLIFLQHTITETHNIDLHGVQELLRPLEKTIKNIYFVFVVSEERAGQYSRPQQNVPDADVLRPGATDLTVTQFRLIFTNNDIKSVADRDLVG